LHPLLVRQLKKSNIDSTVLEAFLELVSQAYVEFDEHIYTLERSLEISLEEMNFFNKEQKESFSIQLKAIINAMPDLLFLNDENGKFLEVFVNNNMDLFVSKEKMIGKNYSDIFSKDLAVYFQKNITTAIRKNRLNVIEYDLNIENKLKHYEARIMPIGVQVNNKETVVVIVRNVSKAKKTENRLKYIAMHDTLTQLPNRFLFQKNLKRAIKYARKEKKLGGLFFLDIDRFKEINDNLGHDIGDALLVKCAKRLKKIKVDEYLLSRFGGDEFTIIVEKLKREEDVMEIAKSIMSQFEETFKVGKYSLDISCSIGIAIFSKDSTTATQIIKQADTAMYHAKAVGRNNHQVFTKALSEKAYEKFILETYLKGAIKNNEFSLVYQPQVRLCDRRVIGLEVLIRWENNRLGSVSPAIFIPIAEQCGYIESITDWVIDAACKQINIWDKQGLNDFTVSINLSRRELGKRQMIERVSGIIMKHGIDFKRIDFEVTESALFGNGTEAFKNIAKLRTLGFLTSIDDFGTGYSSLANLKDLLFDKLKIDRSFTKDIGLDNGYEVIIKATIALAKSLNLRVVAEGVETQEQLDFFIDLECDEIQGYFFSPPVKAEQMNKILKNIVFFKE